MHRRQKCAANYRSDVLVFALNLRRAAASALRFGAPLQTLGDVIQAALGGIERITKSDLLIINKIDLAPLVGASLEVMDRDAKKMRNERPFVFSNLKTGQGVDTIVKFIETEGML